MGKMIPANVKVSKLCAFCKYWYDPSNSCIQPKAPRIGTWLYDYDAKMTCVKKGIPMPSRAACKNYECKV